MYDSVIKLVSQTTSVNEYGDSVVTETERAIFAEVKSIGQSEFYQAQALGLKPEIKFVIADFADYEGEEILRYAPFGSEEEEDFRIIRTYRTKMALEIVCKRGIE